MAQVRQRKTRAKQKQRASPRKKVKKALKEALPAGPAVAKKTKGEKGQEVSWMLKL